MLALFVRVVDPDATRAPRRFVASEADLALVRRHHMLFYALVIAAPIEWWLRGSPAEPSQLFGALVAAAGVVGYRRAGATLGDQLGPLVAPVEPARLVERGFYAGIRHPMYLAEIAMAFGVPVELGCRFTLLLAAGFALAVLRRIGIEERALAERLPDYAAYAARTARLIPHVY